MDFDLDKWKADFVKDMKFGSDDEKATFLKAIDGNVDTIKKGYNTVSEGSRLANEALETKKAADEAKRLADEALLAAQKKDADADAYYAQLKAHETDVNTELGTLRAADAKYKEILVANGIDPTSAVGRELIKQNAEPTKTDFKEMDSRYLTNALARNIALVATELPFQVAAVQSRYEQLYGSTKDVDWMAFGKVAKEKLLKEGISAIETGAELFKFAEKAAEKSEADIEARIEAKSEEKLTAKLSAMNLPNPQAGIPNPTGPNFFSPDFANHVEGQSPSEVEAAALKHFIDTTNEAGMPTMSYG